jgi:NAD(P)H-flavin reductase
MSMATHLAGAPDPLLPQIMQVRRRTRETHDTVTLTIAPPQGALPAFEPGQFNMLYVFGKGEIPVSFSGAPGVSDRWIHTVRAVGAVSRAIAALKTGDSLGVRGPFGTAWPVAAGRGGDVLLLAGGLGLAPLRPALYALLADRQSFGRITLLYGSRGTTDLLYRGELEQWRKRLDLDVEVAVDHADAQWHGNVGVVTTLIRRAAFDPARGVAFVCGPEVMMRFALGGLVEAGLAPERIWLSMERNMKCAVGHCGHCQFGPTFVCRDGAVFRSDTISGLLGHPEI